jgi:hypothetical protein
MASSIFRWTGNVRKRPSGDRYALSTLRSCAPTSTSAATAGNPEIVVHLESGSEVVVIEGRAHAASPPERRLAERLAAALAAKYAESHDYRPGPGLWDKGGLWPVRPRVAFGWSEFPKTVTRWRF